MRLLVCTGRTEQQTIVVILISFVVYADKTEQLVMFAKVANIESVKYGCIRK